MKKYIMLFFLFASSLQCMMQDNYAYVCLVELEELSLNIFARLPIKDKDNMRTLCKAWAHYTPKHYPLYVQHPLVATERHIRGALSCALKQPDFLIIKNIFKHHTNKAAVIQDALFEAVKEPSSQQSTNAWINIITWYKKRYDINARNSNKQTLLWCAVLANNIPATQALLQHKECDPNWMPSNVSLLYKASLEEHLECVKLLLCHPRINSQITYLGFVPLHAAAQKGHSDLVTLLAKHYDINSHNSDGATPLYLACQEGKLDVVSFLLSQENIQPDLTYKTGFSAMYVAARNGHHLVVQRLLDDGRIDKEQACSQGSTALYVASQKGHIDTVKILCAYGANVNAEFGGGYTPLYIAAQYGHKEIVEILLRDPERLINKVAPNNGTPLFVASQKNHPAVVALLLTEPDIDTTIAEEIDGYTALHIAAAKNHTGIVQQLVKHTSQLINMRNSTGNTALHISVERNHFETTELLLNMPDIQVNCVNATNQTPLDMAYKQLRVPGLPNKMVELLQSHGAKRK